MGYAEKRGEGSNAYYRARYKKPDGKYGTVKDADGVTRKFRTKREAVQAADDEEAKVRGGSWKDPGAGRLTLGVWASKWFGSLDLAQSTLRNYKRHLEEHILPAFEDWALADITGADIDSWARSELDAGYKPSSVKTWRGTLHTCLADAVEEGLIAANPATRRRGRGKRSGRARDRGPEKVTTDALGALLIAERCSLLSGRADDFVAMVLKFYTGLRWAELVGLETRYVRPGSIRVEWQLYELDTGELIRIPPKDDSYRDVDLPEWLARMVSAHIARTTPRPCTCHGRTYVFSGTPAAPGKTVKLAEVAERAGVAVGTVSNVLNRPERVAEATRERVEKAIDELGYARTGHAPAAAAGAAHWRRSGFGTWVFQPAATGWYPPKAPQPARPVPVAADPFPGVPVRGRGAAGRADWCWTPIAQGLTPHGLRHSHKTAMVEMRVPEILSHERLGHQLGGIGARYSHVTPAMRAELLDGLTARWEAALDARAAMHPRSPVPVLDELLQERREGAR
ncbi:integrase [Actinomadura cellulosilytica]|uniref:Integrase n=1 Tax=Thermomonospora cellulosilytica TaxID=1411118 RepID=A0A7W3R6E0_9ACTN|nr:integrase [Thermomonospora cellulosilytica]